MSISQTLLPEFDQEMANTRKILERVPEDDPEYRPHAKSMTLSRLAGHIAEMPFWAKTTIDVEVLELQPGQKPNIMTSRAELLESFDKNVIAARAAIAGAPDELLMKTWTMKFGGKPIMSMPRAAVLRSIVMNHMIHHRAQLGVYLRLKDIEVPGMYGPSADEMKFWEAKSPN